MQHLEVGNKTHTYARMHKKRETRLHEMKKKNERKNKQISKKRVSGVCVWFLFVTATEKKQEKK